MRPEDALPTARERAAAARAAGAYADDLSGFTIAPTDRVSMAQLMEWAVIEPDEELLRSTRRGPVGAVISAFKRVLLRALQQHFNEITALQTRFNFHVLVQVAELEDRVRRLEERVPER